MLQDPMLRPRACGWTDQGSGIMRIRYELYYMQPGVDGLLAKTGRYVWDAESTTYLQASTFQYVLSTSGVYVLELTVLDYANNYAKARKLFIYTDNPGITGIYTFIV